MAKRGTANIDVIITMIPIVVILIFATVSFFGYRQYQKNYDAYTNKCTENITGIVVDQDIQTSHHTHSGSRRSGGTYRSRSHTTYYAIIDYCIDGENYTDSFTVGSLNNYEIGTAVLLRYDPDDPETAFIDGNEPQGGKALLIIFAVTSVSELFLIIKAVTKSVKNKKVTQNIAGQTFEEWQNEQRCKQNSGMDYADTSRYNAQELYNPEKEGTSGDFDEL